MADNPSQRMLRAGASRRHGARRAKMCHHQCGASKNSKKEAALCVTSWQLLYGSSAYKAVRSYGVARVTWQHHQYSSESSTGRNGVAARSCRRRLNAYVTRIAAKERAWLYSGAYQWRPYQRIWRSARCKHEERCNLNAYSISMRGGNKA